MESEHRILTQHKVDSNTNCTLIFSGDVISHLGAHHKTLPDIKMLRNFTARGKVCLETIYSLWKMNRVHDALILQRHLIDLAVTIAWTAKNNSYDGFRYYTLRERCRVAKKMLNDKALSSKMSPQQKEEQRNHVRAFQRAGKPEIEWHQPRKKDVEEVLTWPEVGNYIQSYNALSLNIVHPVSDTGTLDFLALNGVDPVKPEEKLVEMENANVCMLILLYRVLDAAYRLTQDNRYLDLQDRLLRVNKY